MGLVSGHFPNRGLVFPKADEKPPFMTRPEIERRIDEYSRTADAEGVRDPKSLDAVAAE